MKKVNIVLSVVPVQLQTCTVSLIYVKLSSLRDGKFTTSMRSKIRSGLLPKFNLPVFSLLSGEVLAW